MKKLITTFAKSTSKCTGLDIGFGTKCVHSGVRIDTYSGAINVPICQSSTFSQLTPGQNHPADCTYTRLQNPSRKAVEELVADLENGKYCNVSSSGMASVSNVIFSLEKGDHIISIDDIYGGTSELFDNIIGTKGLSVTYSELLDLEEFKKCFKSTTKLIWIETPSNPLLKVVDIEAICEIAHERGAIVCVDNTFATPYFQNPLALGADIVVHSLTKYINGHADVLMGATVTNDEEIHEKILYNSQIMGPCPSPFDCYLALRGAKTLKLRMQQVEKNAKRIAEYLEGHPLVKKVFYPGLSSHPSHDIAVKQMRGFGGVIAFYIDGGFEESSIFLESLRIFELAISLGSVQSLSNHPALMTHAGVPEDIRESCNITNNLIRLSIGIEEGDDLLEDLEQAFNCVETLREPSLMEKANSSFEF